MTAYVILTRERTLDPAEMEIYKPMAADARQGHAITPRARYGRFEVLEGEPIEGAMVLEFPTFAEAKAWYDSPKYQAALIHRKAGSDYRVFIVEGVS
jgi:uncharacterized protein (DUF1330 family)